MKTYRGVSVGDSESALQSIYGKGTVNDSDNQYWVYYNGDGKRLLFQIKGHLISHIMMVFNNSQCVTVNHSYRQHNSDVDKLD